MKANRILAVLIVLACVLATVAALRPRWVGCQWSRNEHLPLWRVVLPPDDLTTARMQRLLLKVRAVRRLADGELTLFETAALFRQLNSMPPVLEVGIRPLLSE